MPAPSHGSVSKTVEERDLLRENFAIEAARYTVLISPLSDGANPSERDATACSCS